MNTQRKLYKAGRLLPGRAVALEAIPGWAWSRNNSNWLATYATLQAFVAERERMPLAREEAQNGTAIGNWVSTQRILRKEGKLSQDRAAALEAIPGWTWDALDDAWQAACATLQAFVAERGRLPLGLEVAQDGMTIGRWVRTQRKMQKEGNLSQDRAAALEAVPGWTWNARPDAVPRSATPSLAWRTRLAALRAYVATHGRLPCRRDANCTSRLLGRWVHLMRQRRSTLAETQILQLETVPGWRWDKK